MCNLLIRRLLVATYYYFFFKANSHNFIESSTKFHNFPMAGFDFRYFNFVNPVNIQKKQDWENFKTA